MLVHNFMEFKPKMISSLKEESRGNQGTPHICVTLKEASKELRIFSNKECEAVLPASDPNFCFSNNITGRKLFYLD